jgi:hypothetical protein
MGTGQVGYIEEARIDCEGRKPSSIDFLITGKKEE